MASISTRTLTAGFQEYIYHVDSKKGIFENLNQDSLIWSPTYVLVGYLRYLVPTLLARKYTMSKDDLTTNYQRAPVQVLHLEINTLKNFPVTVMSAYFLWFCFTHNQINRTSSEGMISTTQYPDPL